MQTCAHTIYRHTNPQDTGLWTQRHKSIQHTDMRTYDIQNCSQFWLSCHYLYDKTYCVPSCSWLCALRNKGHVLEQLSVRHEHVSWPLQIRQLYIHLSLLESCTFFTEIRIVSVIDIAPLASVDCLRLNITGQSKPCNIHLKENSKLWKYLIEELIGGKVC